MAIQVNGTEVISNSRALNNIATVDATTAAAIGAAGVGGSPALPNWDPSATPDVTFSNSGTWTNPNTSDTTWVIFYLVGGGGNGASGASGMGGGGGGATVVAGLMGDLPSSITVTIGNAADGNGGAGYPCSIAANGVTFTAPGGRNSTNGSLHTPGQRFFPSPSNPFGKFPADDESVTGGVPGWYDTPGLPSTFGGGGGGGGYDGTQRAGGVSTYAGNGGYGTSSFGQDGASPGGGGGGAANGGSAPGEGARGNLRIYYMTA